jgi:hypothetical protein
MDDIKQHKYHSLLLPILLILLQHAIEILGLPLHPDHRGLEAILLLVLNVKHAKSLEIDVIDPQCKLEVNHGESLQSDRVELEREQFSVFNFCIREGLL